MWGTVCGARFLFTCPGLCRWNALADTLSPFIFKWLPRTSWKTCTAYTATLPCEAGRHPGVPRFFSPCRHAPGSPVSSVLPGDLFHCCLVTRHRVAEIRGEQAACPGCGGRGRAGGCERGREEPEQPQAMRSCCVGTCRRGAGRRVERPLRRHPGSRWGSSRARPRRCAPRPTQGLPAGAGRALLPSQQVSLWNY